MTRRPAKPSLEKRIEDWVLDVPLIRSSKAGDATLSFLLTPTSIHTRKAYFYALQRFMDWAMKNEIGSLADVDGKIVRRHIEGIMAVKEKTKATFPGKTRSLDRTVIATYYDALLENGIVKANTIRTYRPRGFSKHTTSTPALTVPELERLIASIPIHTPEGLRNRALIMFLSATACRVGAALKLTHRAFYEANGQRMATLYEKKGDKRDIALPNALIHALDAYLTCEPQPPDGPVFRAFDGRKRTLSSRPMPYIEAYDVIQAAALRAGIEKHVTPHVLRATAITALRAHGYDIETCQRIAGHAHPDTTRKYDRNSLQPKAEDFDNLAAVLNLPSLP